MNATGSESERMKVCCPKREIADHSGSGPRLTQETQGVLRYRLRAAAFILLIGFGAFLIRHLVGVFGEEPLDPWLLGSHILVVLALAASSLPLCRECCVSLRKLRLAELIIFGLPAAFFLLLQQRVTHSEFERGYMPTATAFWPVLIFTYGMFIPNTWRRAAVVIGVMALAPVLLVGGMMLGDEKWRPPSPRWVLSSIP
jgi:serine/threonine-protein kinase